MAVMKPLAGAGMQRKAVVAYLEDAGLVDAAAVTRAELHAARSNQPVEQVLNQMGALTDDDLARAYAAVAGCEVWEPTEHPVQVRPEEIGVTVEFLRRGRLLPLQASGRQLLCAACDPLDNNAVAALVFATKRNVTVLAARPADWKRALEAAFPAGVEEGPAHDHARFEREIEQVADPGAEGSGARLVGSVFEAAIAAGASDIHFEPRRHDLRIRLRVDGRLIDHQLVSADLAGPAVSRVKVIANLDLGERRLPQDGRTTFVIAGRQVDVRVATSPTVFGEAAVLRILDRASVSLELGALGLDATVLDVLRRAARSPHGMFLVTGPTGSGKTTTLYALLQTFAGSAKKVLSVEDPVEYQFEHVVQTQVASQIGLTFASALRSFLRQDPDVILVGEIRDPETAAVAVQAAMTGHFVLASVHANHALAVIPRLQDMGVEPYQLAAGFRGAAAQRLVRRLCAECRRERPMTEAEAAFAAAEGAGPFVVHAAPGCRHCRESGYRGRVAIGEGFLADDDILRAIADRSAGADLADLLRRQGFRSMAQDGLEKVRQGLTSVDEVMAAVHG